MNDDFNTPLAVAVLFDLVAEINRGKSPILARQLRKLAAIIGLLERPPQQFLQGGPATIGTDVEHDLTEIVATHIAARTAAKLARNFVEADRIRAELLDMGIMLEDKPGGVTEWRRV